MVLSLSLSSTGESRSREESIKDGENCNIIWSEDDTDTGVNILLPMFLY